MPTFFAYFHSKEDTGFWVKFGLPLRNAIETLGK